MLTNTKKSSFAKVSPMEWNNVRLKEGFWDEVVKNNAKNTIPHLQTMFEDKDISHVLENFRICAGEAKGDHAGTVFGDGDFYKWMEGAIYSAAMTNDLALFEQLEEYCDLIGRAQQEDGYLSTKQIIGEMNQSGVTRMGDINDFEIYNFGHLFTTACLYYRVTKKDTLLVIAKKAADYLEKLYYEAKEKGEMQTAVCPSHYMGLIEMYRTTEDKRYLELAKLAIELRDSVKDGTDDNQDRIPLKEHDKIIGHAVRANYLYAGVADLYLENGDDEYLSMLHKVWKNLIEKKIYITGGCGALYNGASPYGNFFIDQMVHQAYGYEYQLPNITAYNETCASIGFVLWAYRMYQIEPKAEYMDWIERAMLNVNLASVSFDGKRYFYENMLRRTKELDYELIWPLERTEYILSYCCPPNIARVLSQMNEYFYFTSEDTLWCGLYGANEAEIKLDNGALFTLVQESNYPYEGKIVFKIKEVKNSATCNLNIRIPSWAKTGYLKTKDHHYEIKDNYESGYYSLKVLPEEGQVIEVYFDMPVRYIQGHAKIEETVNQVAIERGPLVYCMENPDVDLDTLDDLMFDLDATFKPVDLTIKGRKVTALEGSGLKVKRDNYNPNALYQRVQFDGVENIDLQLIPYFAWDNRGFGEMRIWTPVAYKK